MGPRHANIATLAERKAPGTLREAALHPGPERIAGFELGCLLALARGLDRLMVGLGPHGELPRGISRRRAYLPGETGTTGGAIKANADDGCPSDIPPWRPLDTRLSLGTARLVGLPIYGKDL